MMRKHIVRRPSRVHVATSAWSATYNAERNAWTSPDGNIERFLNARCVPPNDGDVSKALGLASRQWPQHPFTVTDPDAVTPTPEPPPLDDTPTADAVSE